jgi:hypothetical protein
MNRHVLLPHARSDERTSDVIDLHVIGALLLTSDLALLHEISLPLTTAALSPIVTECEMGIRVQHRVPPQFCVSASCCKPHYSLFLLMNHVIYR